MGVRWEYTSGLMTDEPLLPETMNKMKTEKKKQCFKEYHSAVQRHSSKCTCIWSSWRREGRGQENKGIMAGKQSPNQGNSELRGQSSANWKHKAVKKCVTKAKSSKQWEERERWCSERRGREFSQEPTGEDSHVFQAQKRRQAAEVYTWWSLYPEKKERKETVKQFIQLGLHSKHVRSLKEKERRIHTKAFTRNASEWN